MSNIGALLNAAEGNTKLTGIQYIKDMDGLCVSFNHDTGEAKRIKKEEIPDGSTVVECVRTFIIDDVLGYAEDTGYNYKLTILKGTGGSPVWVGGFDHPEVTLSGDGWDFTILFSTDKFLGIATYGEGVMANGRTPLYGSSMYLKWDGKTYSREIGQLDDWYAGETDNEYKVSDDGERLEYIPHANPGLY